GPGRLTAALEEGQEVGMTGLILDLRGNPGGLVVEALGVASQFLPDGTPLFQRVDAEGNSRVTETVGNNGAYLDGPMVVLVDGNSASSAEIVAGAIQESGRARSEEHTSELQSRENLVCRLLLEK